MSGIDVLLLFRTYTKKCFFVSVEAETRQNWTGSVAPPNLWIWLCEKIHHVPRARFFIHERVCVCDRRRISYSCIWFNVYASFWGNSDVIVAVTALLPLLWSNFNHRWASIEMEMCICCRHTQFAFMPTKRFVSASAVSRVHTTYIHCMC